MTNTQRFDGELDLLLRMRERLSDPQKWCGDGTWGPYGAKGEDGNKWCLVRTGVRLDMEGVWLGLYYKLARLIGPTRSILSPIDVGEWNDSHTHADVLDLLDRAIAERTAELAETA